MPGHLFYGLKHQTKCTWTTGSPQRLSNGFLLLVGNYENPRFSRYQKRASVKRKSSSGFSKTHQLITEKKKKVIINWELMRLPPGLRYLSSSISQTQWSGFHKGPSRVRVRARLSQMSKVSDNHDLRLSLWHVSPGRWWQTFHGAWWMEGKGKRCLQRETRAGYWYLKQKAARALS